MSDYSATLFPRNKRPVVHLFGVRVTAGKITEVVSTSFTLLCGRAFNLLQKRGLVVAEGYELTSAYAAS